MDNRYVILGIHYGRKLARAGDEPVPGVPDDKVYARVRMFVGDKQIDENFDLPEMFPGVPLETQQLVYEAIMKDKFNARMLELQKGNIVSGVHSDVKTDNGEPIFNIDQEIAEAPNV